MNSIKKFLYDSFTFVLDSYLFIAFTAVVLGIGTQVQFGIDPLGNLDFLVLIFVATLLEYNLFRIISFSGLYEKITERKLSLWVNLISGFIILVCAVLVYFVLTSKIRAGYVPLILLGTLSLFYSFPFTTGKYGPITLRNIPFLKIFLISFVWASVTVYLPLVWFQSNVLHANTVLLFFERFLLVFAVTLPFDVRDMENDRKAGIQTIPLKIGEKNALLLAVLTLVLFCAISVGHYLLQRQWGLVLANFGTFVSTYFCMTSPKLRNIPFYHYGILDGCLLLHGLLVILIG